jgi:DtxR family transcriptional regulator, Mn-dependent transcriptional regulator
MVLSHQRRRHGRGIPETGASQTVENYLKAIYQGQLQLVGDARLVPMGQVASMLGVTPGTATTMVKALAESGLAEYEPYSGVRLSAAGEKLAGLVLRRHRLVELFLVKVMGMSWAEVHEEAEQLEHVVSERLIERIDEMLGRPTHDPHGDPIPTAEGRLAAHRLESLLTCPLGIPLRVTRIADQDPAFLRFIEHNELKPGEPITVEARNAAADAVTVRGRRHASITIGTRAASKLLVEAVAIALAILLGASVPAGAQAAAAPAPTALQQFEVIDNSFLVEEAFNQEPEIFQNIFSWLRSSGGEWQATLTQEWPVPGKRHQLSFTLPFGGGLARAHFGDTLVNYRYQLLEEGAGRPAFAPRLSVILPTDSSNGGDRAGAAVNLPFSKQVGNVYWHWNAGFTWQDTVTPVVAASAILRLSGKSHLMLESVLSWDPDDAGGRETTLTIAPGFRRGWNVNDRTQLVIGVGVPVTSSGDDTTVALLTYLSYELPFK